MTTDKVTDATVEPLTLADAKAHLRETLADAANDAYITSLITVARTTAEDRLQRTLTTTTWLLTLDQFPGSRYPQNPFQPHPLSLASVQRFPSAIALEYPPLISVDWVKYIDTAGAQQTLDPANYIVDAGQQRGQLMPAYGQSWPVTQARINAVTIQYKAGYGADASKVPPPIIQWIKLALADMYFQRRRSANAPVVPHDFADGLLMPYKVWSI